MACIVSPISSLTIQNRSIVINCRQRRRDFHVSSFWKLSKTDKTLSDNSSDSYPLSAETSPFKGVTDFIRFRNAEELQTAVVTYRKPFPWSLLQPNFQVDLVAAVHIADDEYFSSLQQFLEEYDRVLYEMVVEKDTKNPNVRWRPPKTLNKKLSYVGFIQSLMANLANLSFQLERIDYTRDNWYHADLDYKTFVKLQLEKGETLVKLAMEMATSAISNKYQLQGKSNNIIKRLWLMTMADPTKNIESMTQSETKDSELWRSKVLKASQIFPKPLVISILMELVCTSPAAFINESPEMQAFLRLDLSAAIKLFLAKQIAFDLLDGTTDLVAKSVVIGERNRVAMEELRSAMNDGCSKIAIFYGGGHMPDLDRRIREDFKLVPSKMSWKTAWRIKSQRKDIAKEPPAFFKTIKRLYGWTLNRYQVLALLIFSVVLATDLWFWELFIEEIKDWVA